MTDQYTSHIEVKIRERAEGVKPGFDAEIAHYGVPDKGGQLAEPEAWKSLDGASVAFTISHTSHPKGRDFVHNPTVAIGKVEYDPKVIRVRADYLDNTAGHDAEVEMQAREDAGIPLFASATYVHSRPRRHNSLTQRERAISGVTEATDKILKIEEVALVNSPLQPGSVVRMRADDPEYQEAKEALSSLIKRAKGTE